MTFSLVVLSAVRINIQYSNYKGILLLASQLLHLSNVKSDRIKFLFKMII
jgi:hypothetical protein